MKKILLILLMIPQLTFAMVGLQVGDSAPNLTLQDTEGKSFNFSKEANTTVVVFYRGAWCPYCMTQLKSIQSEVVDSVKNRAQIVAVSVDRLMLAKKMRNKYNFSFKVLSDPKASSLKAFKIANKVSDELVKKYKSSYKIDIEADSGETHHMVAHPAVFIIKKGKVVFADIHLDYKVRTKNSQILDALK
ncbi:hypothetical protein A9Q84_14335 [Halobacteriovorax marinus]|uniref:thioredoxin-dependent peroxiredoxin n=1 Tax=Halobacteriovorax marinus TaxID=97084 RepID=A0A1Y5FBA0_9BACT|nr:hypothetical protein A9Q84_14335 [Halobacteriovorax marinus]